MRFFRKVEPASPSMAKRTVPVASPSMVPSQSKWMGPSRWLDRKRTRKRSGPDSTARPPSVPGTVPHWGSRTAT